jgi:hypothetical protein
MGKQIIDEMMPIAELLDVDKKPFHRDMMCKMGSKIKTGSNPIRLLLIRLITEKM